MNSIGFGAEVEPMVMFLPFALISLLQLVWYVGVTVMLYKIWRKVKHLPG
jgi:hypothetical protein